MEKVLSMMPNNENIKADKILEINTNHDMFNTIKNAFKDDKEQIKNDFKFTIQSSFTY